jgi:hypothetical protein
LLLEVGHADSGKSRGPVVLSGVVVNFMDGDGGVDNFRLNDLPLNDRLNGLMNVVVDVLSSDSWGSGASLDGLALDTSVTELGSLHLDLLGDITVVAMVEFSDLDRSHVMNMLLRGDLTI